MRIKEKEFINNHEVAHLSTVDENGNPHIVPIVYAYDGDVIYTPIDSKPKKREGTEIQRVKNIRYNSSVSVVIDDYSENWDKLSWVQIRGNAELTTEGPIFGKGVDLIINKYPQYSKMNLDINMIIVINPTKIVSWRV
ncbi:MAG: TIGR03668 family PPOX class F420-dependent oxidoreductase [Thermodesulfobacteriota bacterium]